MDVPWRVVLNECIELAKGVCGTDGLKYVNAVLNNTGSPACVPTKSLPTKRLGKPGPEAAAAEGEGGLLSFPCCAYLSMGAAPAS